MTRNKARRGRPTKDRRPWLNIAVTTECRGEEDGQLAFLCRGAFLRIITECFRYLVGNGCGIAEKATVTEHTAPRHHNGRNFHYIEALLESPNDQFASKNDMRILIEATLHRLHPCHITWIELEDFMNL